MLSSNSQANPPRKAPNNDGATLAAVTDPSPASRLVGKEIYFAEGLLGFPNDRRFKFTQFSPGDGGDSPFFLLDGIDRGLSFPLIHPDLLSVDFQLPVFPELLDCLQTMDGADLVPLLIVTVRDRVDTITVNLQGPLVINPQALCGIQLVIENYPLRHPLLPPGAAQL